MEQPGKQIVPEEFQAKSPRGEPTRELLPIASIRRDGKTQTRLNLNQEAVENYAELMEGVGPSALPPVVVLKDGEGQVWLADGFHRVQVAEKSKHTSITAQVRPGTRLDALKYSFQANENHGVRRTNADKRYSVKIVLTEEAFRDQGDNSLAELCGVSNHLVADVRRVLEERGELQVGNSPTSSGPTKRIGKDKKRHPARKRRKAKSSTDVALAPGVNVADNQDEDAESEDTNAPLDATTPNDALGAQAAPAATMENEAQPPVEALNEEAHEAEPSLERTEADVTVNPTAGAPVVLAVGNGHPTDDARWDDGILTAEEIRARLELMPRTHPYPSGVEQKTLQDCFLELVRTVNRLAQAVCVSRSTRKEIALDAAKALGSFISTRSTAKYKEQHR